MTKTELTLLQINDLHGYVRPHSEMVRDVHGDWSFAELGGLARIAGLFEAARTKRPGSVIALDNGDTFHGTHLAVASKGRAQVPIMNALALDALTVHWEFAYGLDVVRELDAMLNFRFWPSTATTRPTTGWCSLPFAWSSATASASPSSAWHARSSTKRSRRHSAPRSISPSAIPNWRGGSRTSETKRKQSWS